MQQSLNLHVRIYSGKLPHCTEKNCPRLSFNPLPFSYLAEKFLNHRTVEAVKLYSYQSSYYPIPLPGTPANYPSFPALASFLIDVEAAVQNLTMAAYQQLETKYGLNVPGNPLEWARAIQCTDNGNVLNGRTLPSLLPSIALLEAQSYVRIKHSFPCLRP